MTHERLERRFEEREEREAKRARHEGRLNGRWAVENIPNILAGRDGYPHSRDIVTHSPDWTTGYIAGAKEA